MVETQARHTCRSIRRIDQSFMLYTTTVIPSALPDQRHAYIIAWEPRAYQPILPEFSWAELAEARVAFDRLRQRVCNRLRQP